MTDRSENNNQSPNFDFIKYLASIMKSVGLTGFITIMVTFIFLVFSTSEQKELFISRWILLENAETQPLPCVIIIVFLSFIILMITIYCNKVTNLRKEENNRIGQEKSDLQALLINENSK